MSEQALAQVGTDQTDEAEQTVLWMRRWMRTGDEQTDPMTGLLTGERALEPARWHLEAPIPERARPFHHYQAWCGVQLGKYRPQVLLSDFAEMPEEVRKDHERSGVCLDCLRLRDAGSPRPWRKYR